MNRCKDALGLMANYASARKLLRLRTREQIRSHQQQRWQVMREQLALTSPFYAECRHRPFDQWPLMDKQAWMEHFDRINTAGISLSDAYTVAERAEQTRDFRPALGDISVGLSTGTSGVRGIFLASGSERQRWAATMLAKLLPEGIFTNARVALLLRAGSNLYDTINGVRLKFRFFDLTQPLDRVLEQLEDFSPTILVGPAQVLALVAGATQMSRPRINPQRVISAAEVLDPVDQVLMEKTWGIRVEQIYQATEGFLGKTCAHGVIHLNEDCLIVERDWIDREHRRFVPIITDLYRSTQPVVRYRLNDVLVERATPCLCGSAHIALDGIEGREDDVIWLDAATKLDRVPIFADILTRTVLNADPMATDYQIDQHERNTVNIAIEPAPDSSRQSMIRDALERCFHSLHADVPIITFTGMPQHRLEEKRRRVRCLIGNRKLKHA